MNGLIFFVGGLCLITGVYGLFQAGYAPILILAVTWGALLIGYELGSL